MTRNKFTKKNYKYVDYEVIGKIIGRKLLTARVTKGISQMALSYSSGVNKNTIAALEKGIMTAKTDNLMKIVIALDISFMELFSEVDCCCQTGKLFQGTIEDLVGGDELYDE